MNNGTATLPLEEYYDLRRRLEHAEDQLKAVENYIDDECAYDIENYGDITFTTGEMLKVMDKAIDYQRNKAREAEALENYKASKGGKE